MLSEKIPIKKLKLCILQNIQLPELRLIKWVASCVNDMAKLTLLCQNEHRAQEGLHRFRDPNTEFKFF